MSPFEEAYLLLKDAVRSGMYRHATIPDDKRKPVNKVSKDPTRHPFANRFGTMAISQALADMGKPIVPETPMRDGSVNQEQMDRVFGPGRHDFDGHYMDVADIASDPIMGALNLSDTKGSNVGMKDNRVKVFDPSYLTLGIQRNGINAGHMNNAMKRFTKVPKEELQDFTNKVTNYKSTLNDNWGHLGTLEDWQSQMENYLNAKNDLQFVNSIVQDPAQKKLFEFGDNDYADRYRYMVNAFRGEL